MHVSGRSPGQATAVPSGTSTPESRGRCAVRDTRRFRTATGRVISMASTVIPVAPPGRRAVARRAKLAHHAPSLQGFLRGRACRGGCLVLARVAHGGAPGVRRGSWGGRWSAGEATRRKEMLTRTLRSGRLLAAAAMLLLGTGLACPTPAAAKGKWARRQARLASCPHNRTTLRIDKKVCPANRHRPALTLRRACCVNPNGHVMCKPFPGCPPRSPS